MYLLILCEREKTEIYYTLIPSLVSLPALCSRKIARAVIAARPLSRTSQLAAAIASVVPRMAAYKSQESSIASCCCSDSGHCNPNPCGCCLLVLAQARVFQALRVCDAVFNTLYYAMSWWS